MTTERKERPHCSSSLYPHYSPAFPSSSSCAHSRLRPYQTQKRLLITAFVSLSSPRKPSSDLGAKRGTPRLAHRQADPVCAGGQLPSGSTAPPGTPSPAQEPWQQPRRWQPAPTSPVAMALQQNCREPRLPAHDTDGTGNLGMASRARLGANPPPKV